MEIHERIKMLRKEQLKLTQEEFASKIKISRSNLGSIEIGRIGITDRVISDICETFNVNEEWLRSGTGETFKQSNKSILSQLSVEFNLDDLDRKIIESYLQLGVMQRRAIKEYIKSLVAAFSSEAAAENNIDEEVESYRHELEHEKSIETLEASQDSNSKIG